MTHGFSATITGMVADRYAEHLHGSGFQVLLFDHRGFGLSSGHPRRVINRWVQARGYSDAIDFLMSRQQEVDPARIAIWGDSLSGAMAIGVAALDPRVRALVTQVPACGAELPPADPDGSLFARLRDAFLNADLDVEQRSITGPMPVVSADQQRTPSLLTPLSAFRWFTHYGTQPGTLWMNEATVVEPLTSPTFHAGLCSPHLSCPSLWVVARDDEMPAAVPTIAVNAYRAAPQPRVLLEIDGGHFSLLRPDSTVFAEVSNAQSTFLSRHLMTEAA
jgi:pimeloyl-ACP methyl ester carboxylesterase